MHSTSGRDRTFANLTPFRSFLQREQLYMFSPFNSSSEKKSDRQFSIVIGGRQNQLKKHEIVCKFRMNYTKNARMGLLQKKQAKRGVCRIG